MASQQIDHETISPSGALCDLSAPLAVPTDKPSGPTLGTRLIIFSALVLPSALIPLLILRRSVNNLHRKIDELRVSTRGLHHESKSVMLELSVRREQNEHLRAMIAETKGGLEHLRRKTRRMRRARADEDERMQDQVQELVASNRAQISRMRELGTSLADVAAFIQEIELQQGFSTPRFDGRGVERLRVVAMQLEGMGKGQTADGNHDKKSSSTENSRDGSTG